MSCFLPVQQFTTDIAGSGTASAAQSIESANLPSDTNKYSRQARIFADVDAIVKFGGASVVADRTVTTGAYVVDNFFHPGGNTEVYDLRPNQTHYSVVSSDGATAGVIKVGLGIGENKNSE